MAKSGRFTKSFGSHLHLHLDWEIVGSQDIANNRSKVKLTLRLQQSGTGIWFSANKIGNLHGSSFTYTGGFGGTGTKILRTREVWITHNSDGSKSQFFSGTFNLNITYSGSYIGAITVSGTANLDTIPRASTLSSFSMGTSLRPSTANSVNLNLSRASSSFRHDIQLRIGNSIIASWNGQSTPTSLLLSSSQVNDLMSKISTSDSATVTLRVQTKSGSTNVGNVISRTSTARISSTVVPIIGNFTTSIAGNGRDKAINKYVRDISRVQVNFTGNAVGGTSVKSKSIKVGDASYNGSSITSGILSTSGKVEEDVAIEVSITDNRNRTTRARTTIKVHNYIPPMIHDFIVTRVRGTDQANVIIKGTWSVLDGDNIINIKVEQRPRNGTWSTLQDITGTTGSIDGSLISKGLADSKSYDYLLTIKDQFGMIATAEQSVGTAIVSMVNVPHGISVGKVWERGTLDVGGDTYIDGKIYLDKGINIDDNRDISETPSEIPGRAVTFNFKRNTSVDDPPISAEGRYSHIMNIAGWSDSSGGYPTQVSFSGDGLATRQGVDDTSWSPWRHLVSLDEDGAIDLGGTDSQWRINMSRTGINASNFTIHQGYGNLNFGTEDENYAFTMTPGGNFYLGSRRSSSELNDKLTVQGNTDILGELYFRSTYITNGNMNNVRETGLYYINRNSSNLPIDSHMYFIVIKADPGGHCVQVGFTTTHGNTAIYLRKYIQNTGWNSWRRILSESF